MSLKQLVLFFVSVLLTFSSHAKEIFVSPAGNDSNEGSRKLPLKTISAAQKMAIEILESGGVANFTIWLSEGIYPIAEPLEFVPIQSNREDFKLIFKAVKGETPVISGGVEITGWNKNQEGFWEASLPASLKGMDNFRELFISGKRGIRARYPNQDYLHIQKAGEDRRTNFYFEKGDFPIPQNLRGLELVFLHDWSITRIEVEKIDSVNNQLFAVDAIGAKSPDFFTIDNWEPQPRYFLENSLEFLDAEYEWIFLKDQGKLLLKLPEGSNPSDFQMIVPISEGLLSIIGEENHPIKNIHFEGIAFQFSKWEIPAKGYCGVQACHFDPRPSSDGWSVVPAAISTVWAQDITFTKCSFKNFGGSGIWFGTGSKNCKVVGSEVFDIAGNGIMIGEGQDRKVLGEPWWKSAPTQVAKGNSIENSKISQVGAQFYGAVGIWCGLTAETTINNNDVFDLPYTGISVGWMWNPDPTPARQNTISGNHIYDIMNILSDGGGIYMLGLQPGSKIMDNHIHEVEINAGRAESNGMFLDEGITDVVVESNLVYNIAKAPLRFHRASVNLVKGNYFFCKDGNPPIRYNTTQEADIRQVDNKVFSKGEPNYQKELEKAILRWEKQDKKRRSL